MVYANLIDADKISVSRDHYGHAVAEIDGQKTVLSHIVSIYPISNKTQFLALRDQQGKEVGILDSMDKLDHDSKKIVWEELERSYFLPRIKDIHAINEKLSVLTWEVSTDRGFRAFQVRNPRKNVRAVTNRRFIVKDVDGNRYEIRNIVNLPARAQTLIAEFI